MNSINGASQHFLGGTTSSDSRQFVHIKKLHPSASAYPRSVPGGSAGYSRHPLSSDTSSSSWWTWRCSQTTWDVQPLQTVLGLALGRAWRTSKVKRPGGITTSSPNHLSVAAFDMKEQQLYSKSPQKHKNLRWNHLSNKPRRAKGPSLETLLVGFGERNNTTLLRPGWWRGHTDTSSGGNNIC